MKPSITLYLLAFLPQYLFADTTLSQHRNWGLLDRQNCGENMADRIIGGRESVLGQFPWMARLGYIKPSKGIFEVRRRAFKCGGSLINKLYVLTAAHCVTELEKDVLSVIRLGEYDTRTTVDCMDDTCAPPPQDFKPIKVIVHEKYQNPAMRNDIALIRLDRPAQFHDYVSPICLPFDSLLSMNHMGKKMEVAGWGIDNVVKSSISVIPMVVKVPVIELDHCERSLGSFAHMGWGQICAGGKVGFDSCSGDSGGPMMSPQVVNGPPKYFLIGVVSFGSTRCGSENPAVYTDVAKYMTWILDRIEP